MNAMFGIEGLVDVETGLGMNRAFSAQDGFLPM